MARPINPYPRPGLSAHRSYHGHEQTNGPSIGGENSPTHIYECYEITPKRSPVDENLGRWYRADTRRIPYSEQDLHQFVRKEYSHEYTVIDAFKDKKMQGSKRQHIEDFIEERNASNPDWEYHLKYLKLDRNRKHRDSKMPRQKTLSMMIILERKLRPCNRLNLPLSRTMSSQGPIRASGSLPAANHMPGYLMPSTATAPNSTIRPQYTPGYARRRDSNGQYSASMPQVVDNRNTRGLPSTPPILRTPNYDSDESARLRSASPSSTLSSDTAQSSSRRTSNCSSPFDTAFGSFPRTNTHHAQGFNRRAFDPGMHHPYIDQSTQTEQDLYAPGSSRPNHTYLSSLLSRVGPSERSNGGTSGAHNLASPDNRSKQNTSTSLDGYSDEQETPKPENPQEATGITFEKPAWMYNLQPVNTPSAINENIDPFNKSVDKIATDKFASDKTVNPPAKEASNSSPTSSTANTQNRKSKTTPPKSVHEPPIRTPTTKPTISHLASNTPPIDKDITISSYFSSLPDATRLPIGGYIPPPPPPPPSAQSPLSPSQPRRHSDELSSQPPRNKSVRFDLSAHAHTVPSTPTATSPLPSPPSDSSSASSSSASASIPTPKTPSSSPRPTSTLTPPSTTSSARRPPLPRSSHTISATTSPPASTIARPMPSHWNPPPRSSSYRDLPPSNEEKDWWSTTAPNTNTNRRTSAPTIPQSSSRNADAKVYECGMERCRGLAFASREELSAHMRGAHGKEARGSI